MATPAALVEGCTKNSSRVAAAAVMSNGALVVPVSAPEEADSVYPDPLLSMLKSENVATPATAGLDDVPERVPTPGFTPITSATAAVYVGTVLPWMSCAVTVTAGAMATPATAVAGSTVKASFAAAPGLMSNAALVAPARPVAVAESVYPRPALSMFKSEKVATPATAATVCVPASTAPAVPDPAVIVRVTLPVNPTCTFPRPSFAVTLIAGAMFVPAIAFDGSTVYDRFAAAAALTSNAALVAPLGPVALAARV